MLALFSTIDLALSIYIFDYGHFVVVYAFNIVNQSMHLSQA